MLHYPGCLLLKYTFRTSIIVSKYLMENLVAYKGLASSAPSMSLFISALDLSKPTFYCYCIWSILLKFQFSLQVYYYYPFSALSDPAKLFNDLRWNISRPQGFEAVMRVRCSQVGLMLDAFSSVLYVWIPTYFHPNLPSGSPSSGLFWQFLQACSYGHRSSCGQ